MNLPDLAELTALRGPARGFDLHAHRPALAALQGGHRSAQRGRGIEFEEVRPYVPGDDVRNIDWRVTARRGRVHTKLYREERERPVWLVADLHPGLFFGSRHQLKSAALLRAAALLAWATALGGDRVGAVIADGSTTPHILAPRAREAGVLPILDILVESQPRQPGLPASDNLRAAVASLNPLLKPGSLIVILSDFAGLNSTVEDLLAALSTHCDSRLLMIADPLEQRGLPTGAFRVGLPGRSWWLDGDRSRNAWQAAWKTRLESLTTLAERLRLPLSQVSTHQPVQETLAALLKEPSWAA